jgi:hypothetical protein
MSLTGVIDNPGRVLKAIGLTAIVLLLSVFFGMVAGLGSVLLAALIGSFFIGGALIFLPYTLTVSALVICLVVVGSLETFLSFGKANWLATGIVTALIASALFARPHLVKVRVSLMRNWSRSLMMISIYLYFIVMLVSVIVNQTPFAQLLVGIRYYLPFLGVFLVLALGRFNERKIMFLLYAVIAVACAQWLFCLAEQFYIVPKRMSSMLAVGGGGEAIVGSFGGNPLGGGYTGEMAAFVVMNLVLCTVLWQAKLLPRWVWLLAGLSAGVSVGLAETKIVFVLLPLMVAAVMWRYPGGIDRKVVKLVLVAALGFALTATIYAERYWLGKGEGQFVHAFTYSFDENFMVTAGHRGRLASIVHWGESAVLTGPLAQTLVGYGPAASVEASAIAGRGAAVEIYGPGLNNNALSTLLWDVGLLGTTAFILLVLGAIFEAARLSRAEWVSPTTRWIMVGFKAWMLAFAVMLPYQVSVIGGAPMQFLFWFTLGMIACFGAWSSRAVAPQAVMTGARA